MDNISSEIISQVNTSIGEIPSDSLALISDVGHNNVYRLTQGGRVFAVKTIKPDDANAALQLQFLQREYQLLSSLQSPYIVSVWQMTTHKQLGECLIMEFVDGRTLDKFLQEKVSDKQRHAVLDELLQAVEYMHQKQIVHADLKPQNILITHNGNHVKIIDLGLSDSSSWRTYNIGNTRQYAAPEQQDANNTLDQRTDIYALGHLLKLLFPHRYGSIAKKCLQPNPKDRYASVAVLRSAIKNKPRINLAVAILACFAVVGPVLYFALSYYIQETLVSNQIVDTVYVREVEPSVPETVHVKQIVTQVYEPTYTVPDINKFRKDVDKMYNNFIKACIDSIHNIPESHKYAEVAHVYLRYFIEKGDDERARSIRRYPEDTGKIIDIFDRGDSLLESIAKDYVLTLPSYVQMWRNKEITEEEALERAKLREEVRSRLHVYIP
jgi:serine/threonine protein kinase